MRAIWYAALSTQVVLQNSFDTVAQNPQQDLGRLQGQRSRPAVRLP